MEHESMTEEEMAELQGDPRAVPLPEAARVLGLPQDAVTALADAGFLEPTTTPHDGPRFALGDLKAFLARNSAEGHADMVLGDLEGVDPQELLDALDGKADEMARRTYEIFAQAFPDAGRWSITEQARFIDQATARFEAILAVTGQGSEVDPTLMRELEQVGEAAARAGSPLPELLVVLRISRDLVVQTAVELAEERGRHWGLALSLLLTRVLPAMDRLIDSLAQGYWSAIVRREEERKARYEHVVEHSSDGVFEVDLDGRLRYANASLARSLGLPLSQLEGRPLPEVLKPVDATVTLEDLFGAADGDQPADSELTVVRSDGVRRVLRIRGLARREEGRVVGWAGVARDVTAERELESQRSEFLALVTHDLRQPITTVLGLGATLESYAGELPPARLRRMGASIRSQAERISRLADDLYDVSGLEAETLLLGARHVDLVATVDASLGAVAGTDEVEVAVPEGIRVFADARRVEQIVANLVENALVHGAPPVRVSARPSGDAVVLAVADAGEGVAENLVPGLFSRLSALRRSDRDRSRGTGMGLFLVRGLAEAMGGRVWYEAGPGGGARFCVSLPTTRAPRPHRS